MALSSSKSRKALQIHNGAKQSSTVIRPLTFYKRVLKIAELHPEKSQDSKLSDVGQKERVQECIGSSELLESPLSATTAAKRKDIARKPVESPLSPSKGLAQNSAKTIEKGDVRGPPGGLASSLGSLKRQTSFLKSENKPSSRATHLLVKNQLKNVEMNKILVSVNICGSTGPIRFLVDAKDPVKRVAELALRAYAREGRLPRLGVDCKLFDLYCASDFEANLEPTQPVGSLGARQFILYKRRNEDLKDAHAKPDHPESMPRKFMWNVVNTLVCSH